MIRVDSKFLSQQVVVKYFHAQRLLPGPPYPVENTFIQLVKVIWKQRLLGALTHYLACGTTGMHTIM